MKKLFFAGFSALILFSCQTIDRSDDGLFSIKAECEDFVDTKTTLAIDGQDAVFNWTKQEKVALWTDQNKFVTLYSGNEGSSTIFTTFAMGDALPQTCAISPESIAVSPTTVKLPNYYKWKEGATNAPLYAVYDAAGLNFKQLGAMLRIELIGVPWVANKFVYTADKDITGTYDIVDGQINCRGESSSNSVTFEIGTLDDPEAKRDMVFYVPVPVGSYTSTIALLDFEDDVVCDLVGTKVNDFPRRVIKKFKVTIKEFKINAGFGD